MYLFVNFFIFLSLLCSLYGSELINSKMGLLSQGITNVNNRDYKTIFGLLFEKLGAELYIKSEVQYYDSEKTIIKEFTQNKLNFIVLNPIYYLKHKDEIDSFAINYWSLRKYESKFQKMIIVGHKDSGIHSISDLKGKNIILRGENLMGKIVLDKALLEKESINYKDYIKKLFFVNTEVSAILKVYFKKNDAALVSQSAYDLACEMNPMIKSKLIKIYETEYIFMPIIGVTHNKIPNDLSSKEKEIFKKMRSGSIGKNIFELIKMKDIDMLNKEELEPLKKYYDKYLQLRDKFKEKR